MAAVRFGFRPAVVRLGPGLGLLHKLAEFVALGMHGRFALAVHGAALAASGDQLLAKHATTQAVAAWATVMFLMII